MGGAATFCGCVPDFMDGRGRVLLGGCSNSGMSLCLRGAVSMVTVLPSVTLTADEGTS